MDERVALPPFPPVVPDESAVVKLVRELYAELNGTVLRSALQTASLDPFVVFSIPEDLKQRVRELWRSGRGAMRR